MFAIAAFAVIGQSYCLVLDDYAKLLFTPFPHRIHLFAVLHKPIVANMLHLF